MKVWTVQPVEVYNQVMTTNDYCVDMTKSNDADDLFREPYAWLRKKAVERGLVDNGRGMIWFWYRRHSKRRKMDIRTMRKDADKGSRMCCMTLEVPDDKVLLMDTPNWCARLVNSVCTSPEEDEMELEEIEKFWDDFNNLPKEEQKRRKEESWKLVFDFDHQKAYAIEGIFFGLDKEMIKDVQFFVGTGDPGLERIRNQSEI